MKSGHAFSVARVAAEPGAETNAGCRETTIVPCRSSGACADLSRLVLHVPDPPLASIVIPVWRDEGALLRTLDRVMPFAAGEAELIVACVLGEDSRYEPIRTRYPTLRWVAAPRGRAVQMNAGAAAARGKWLIFLHADSTLPADWLDAIRAANGREDVVGGAFRFVLDSRDWRARVIEAGVRLRVALFGMAYGDQALFVRGAVFTRLGGYRDWPLMEDVDLVRRLTRAGRLLHARSAVVTSARRWERDGWLRRTSSNVALLTRFLLGAPPARLAQQYFSRRPAALVMMGRAPWVEGKTRLNAGLTGGDLSSLRHALFMDTLDVVRTVAGADHIVACDPAEASERLRESVKESIDVIPQRGADLGQRMRHVFEDVFRLGAESVVAIGSDLPDLPARLLEESLAALGPRDDRIVLGPAADGGYYLIGMNRPHPEAFDAIDWSTARVLDQTLAILTAHDVPVTLLPQWSDIDTAADLRRLLECERGEGAARTRAWAAGHLQVD